MLFSKISRFQKKYNRIAKKKKSVIIDEKIGAYLKQFSCSVFSAQYV